MVEIAPGLYFEEMEYLRELGMSSMGALVAATAPGFWAWKRTWAPWSSASWRTCRSSRAIPWRVSMRSANRYPEQRVEILQRIAQGNFVIDEERVLGLPGNKTVEGCVVYFVADEKIKKSGLSCRHRMLEWRAASMVLFFFFF